MGCHDNATYGEGTPCSPSKPCRAPLVCEEGRCALPRDGAAGTNSVAGAESSGGEASADGSSGALGTGGTLTEGGTSGAGGGDPGGTSGGGIDQVGGVGEETGGNSGTTSSVGTQGGGVSRASGGTVADAGAAGSVVDLNEGGTADTGGVNNRGGTDTRGGNESPAGAGGTESAAGGSSPGGGAAGTGGASTTGGGSATGGASTTGGASATGGSSTTGGMAGTTGAGKPVAVSVSAGKSHTCAATLDGRVLCWGADSCNQLGDGRATGDCSEDDLYSTKPVEVADVSGVKAVAAGYSHTCALVTGGTVWCWGTGNWGQMGCDGCNSNASPPVQVDLQSNTARAITAGERHACALLDDDTVECWGWNYHRALGNGRDNIDYIAQTPEPVLVPDGPSTAPLNDVTAISSMWDHTCAVRSDNSVYCWGYNCCGQLGDRNDEDSSLAVLAEDVHATDIAVGAYHSCARDAGGAVVCWGDDDYGELGDGDGSTGGSLSPVTVLLPSPGSATILASGGSHSCAVLDDTEQTAVCWGYNTFGQVGDGTYWIHRPEPVGVLGLSRVKAITGNDNHTCAIVETQENAGAVYCWGYNAFGALGDGTEDDQYVPVLVKGF